MNYYQRDYLYLSPILNLCAGEGHVVWKDFFFQWDGYYFNYLHSLAIFVLKSDD